MADLKGIQQLDLNLLKVFESLFQEQNMTRTAEVLHITPSAVSHAVKRLRDCLDDPLFQRSGHKMLPTPACQRMAPLIIDNLTRLRQILQQWGDFEATTSRHHFRIGMHDALELSVLPTLAKVLSKAAPNVTFSSIKFDRGHLARELAAGHLDVALDVGMALKPPVLHRKLLDDAFCVLMRSHHPLHGRLSRANYLSSAHLSVSNRPSGPAIEDMIFREQGINRQVSIRCQNFYAARAILKDSDNLLTLPSALAKQLVEPGLVTQDVPFTMPPLTTHMYWHQNTQPDAALEWLRATIVDQLMR